MSRPALEQRSLFDLELHPEGEPLDVTAPASEEPVAAVETAAPPAVPFRPVVATLTGRLYATLADLVAHLAVLGLVLAGLRGMGVWPHGGDLVAVAVVMVVFSLFYTVVPLAFWATTPGMALAGLAARGLDGAALSFPQATRRWGASVLTLLSGGLLGLVALSGRSLADRISGTEVVARRG